MPPSSKLRILAPVAVLCLCTSLAYWAGLRQGRGVSVVSSAEGKTGKERRERAAKPVDSTEQAPVSRERVAEELKAFYANGMKGNGTEEIPFPSSLMELADRDPLAAWEILQELGVTRENYHLSDMVLRMMAEKDPRKAYQLALTMAHETHRREALGTVVSTWAEKDPQGALAAALERPETRKSYLLSDIASGWAFENPLAAAAYAASVAPGPARRALLGGVGRSWLLSDPAGFCAWFKGLPDRDSRAVLRTLGQGGLMGEGKSVGLAEARLVWETLPLGNHRMEVAGQLFSRLDFSNPEKGAALLVEISALPDRVMAAAMRKMALRTLAERSPELAAAEYPKASKEERGEMLGPLVQALLGKDRVLAENWVKGLPEGRDREAGLTQLAQALYDDDPEAGLGFFLASPELHQAEGAASLLSNFAYSHLEPELLLQAVPLLKVEDRTGVYENIATQWAGEDLQGCVEWLAKLPAGKERDSMVTGLVSALAEEEPMAALPWAMTIRDPEARGEAAFGILMNWSHTDKDQMEAWLNINPTALPPEKIKMLRQGFKENDGFVVPLEP